MSASGQSQATQFERKIDTARRDTHCAELRRDGLSYRQIAAVMDMSVSGVHKAIRRAIDAVPVEAVSELRTMEAERLDADLVRLNELDTVAWEILGRNHLVVNEGRIVQHDGAPLVDSGPALTALTVLRANCDARRKNRESYRKLFGLDAPTRRIVEVITEDVLDAEIRRLQEEQAELTADGRPRD